MPHRYHTPPVPFERARCAIVRVALAALFSGVWLVTRLLPQGHPVRVFYNGRLPELRSSVLGATVPASHPEQAAVASYRRLWIVGVIGLAALVVGDLSASVPIDFFGLPDVHLGIGWLLGLDADNLVGTPHIFSARLPWSDRSTVGLALLLSCIGTVYALRPGSTATTD